MTKTSFSKVQNLRKERNTDVIRRMKNGDQLSSFNSYSSWFPPRPIIEKDEGAVKELYGIGPRPFRNIQALVSNADQSVEKPANKLRLA